MKRIIGLDALRGVAVILVIFRHSDLENRLLHHFGWLGVDLFFVLSGYLISDLLFKELKQGHSINLKRFLFRRAFKIFPPFYAFILITVLINSILDSNWVFDIKELFAELFYVQNYFPRIWLHTWSLAVEEHFYFIFPIILILLSRKRLIENNHVMISSIVLLIILSLILRCIYSFPHRGDDFYGFTQTHLRLDGILLGILLSYLLNFTELLKLSARRNRLLLLPLILLILPGFYFKAGGFFMNTFGLTLVNVGFAIAVFLSLDLTKVAGNTLWTYLKIPLNILCFVGVNSYSIYLWHLNAKDISGTLSGYTSAQVTLIYFALSILLGVVMSYLIEKPFLKLRVRLNDSD